MRSYLTRINVGLWALAYAAVVVGLWIGWVITKSPAWAAAAYVLGFPAVAIVEVIWLFVAVLVLRFDPTVDAPAWQNVVSIVLTTALAASASLAEGLVLSELVRGLRARRASSRPNRD